MAPLTRTIIVREGEAPPPIASAFDAVSPAGDDATSANCASSNGGNDHAEEEETVVMNPDDSSGSGIDHHHPPFSELPLHEYHHHDQHDSPAATESILDGLIRPEEHEPFLRVVEQEDIEVSAEAILEETGEFDAASVCEQQAIEEEAENDVVVFQTGEEAFGYDTPHDENDVCIQAAEIEIEEEDLNTLAREITPGVAQAVHQPNLHEVDLGRSGLSVSALTTTLALDEDVKLPALPTQAAFGHRTSSGETGDSSRQDQQLIFDDRTISAVDVAWAEVDTPPGVDLPDFKCQAQEYEHATSPPAMPTPSPISSVQVSGGTSSHNTTHTDYSPSEIPVAPAVLVPDEHLAPEDRSPPQSTLTGDNNNNDNNSNDYSRPPKSERNFWMTIIVIALTLNSILVGGIVVGGFCAAGKCAASSAALNDNVTTVMVPTPAPSRRLVASSTTPMPTMAMYSGTSTPYEPPLGTADFPPPPSLVAPQPGQPAALPLPAPPQPTPTPVYHFAPIGILGGGTGEMSIAPTSTAQGLGIATTFPEDDDNTTIQEYDDGFIPEANVTKTDGDGEPGKLPEEEISKAIPLRLMLLIAVLCEAIIASILFCYYRHWRQRVLASRSTPKNTTLPSVNDPDPDGQACDSFV